MNSPVYDLILGNVDGVRLPGDPDPNWFHVHAVETRNQRKVRNSYPMSTKVSDTVDDDKSPDDFRKAQSCDDPLTKRRVSANSGKTFHMKIESNMHMDSSKCFPQLATVLLLLFVYIFDVLSGAPTVLQREIKIAASVPMYFCTFYNPLTSTNMRDQMENYGKGYKPWLTRCNKNSQIESCFHFCPYFNRVTDVDAATFSNIMRLLKHEMTKIDNFIYGIIVYTQSFQYHLSVLRQHFLELHAANLTAKPRKCSLFYPEIKCLGHIVGNEKMTPNPDKVSAIESASKPTTKKQLRSSLDLVGFYRKYIPISL